MIKRFIFLAVLVQMAAAQLDQTESGIMEGYTQEVISDWSSGQFLHEDLNAQCVQDCNRTCVEKCPEAKLCKEDEIECGKLDFPGIVWPDCIKDDICVPADCECTVKGNDGGDCPMWCETHCTDTQLKCPGGHDDNGCKEYDTCIDRTIGNNNQLCPGYCPLECDLETEHVCATPPEDGCPKQPTCKTKSIDHSGKYCVEQLCIVICDATEKFCAGDQMVNGCWEEDICVPKDQNTDESAYCDGNCPVTCQDSEIKCDGTIIYGGDKDGCKNDDTCVHKARGNDGVYCPASSDSHGCPVSCPPDHHDCPALTDPVTGCKLQRICKPCTKDNEDNCCPMASDCPAICQPHEKECQTPGEDENGCPLVPTCIVQERDYYGDLCPVHCPGVCNENQVMCPGGRDDKGCKETPHCEPLSEKLWGEDKGDWCPGFCPADCKDWEQLCASVQDPCDGCPTEPVCRPKAQDVNGINCPPESASHGCAISCKTLDGLETICPAYEDPNVPGCQEPLTCLARTTGNDGSLCPSHSVCPKQCASDEKQCTMGLDANDCKLEDLCIPVPVDTELSQPCMNFECPPVCDEEVQKYCQGSYVRNEAGQLCPERDYCVDRPLDSNSLRCPGHCIPDCPVGMSARAQAGTDVRGCPLVAQCETDE